MFTTFPLEGVEAALIGHFLMFPENVPQVRAQGCAGDWFRELKTRAAWEIIERRKDTGHLTDAPILYDEMGKDKANGVVIGAWLGWGCPTELSLMDCAVFLRERWFAAQRSGFWADGTSANTKSDADAEIKASEGLRATFVPPKEPESLGDALAGLPDAILGERVEDLGVKTGLVDFDEDLGALKPGELIIVAARPGGGKSSLLRQICGGRALAGDRVVLVSVEMSSREVGLALARQTTKIPWTTKTRLPSGLREDFAAQVRRISTSTKLKILPNMPLVVLMSRLETAMLADPQPTIVGIDYIQRIDAERERGETLATAVGRISGALKDFAQKHQIPVLAAAQINRDSQKEAEPTLEHLRDSGALEQDADRVIFLQLEDPANESRYATMKVMQKKHRNGAEGRIRLTFDRWTTRFDNLAP
jgi:hypothetical protein